MFRRVWNWLWSRNTPVRAGVVLIIGGIGGIIFWGGFNTFMEYTNTLEFCISCHEMRDNVYQEYKKTIHYKNPVGVRAVCSDCHVPKPWIPKLIRKIEASNELFHKVMGTIGTKEKFEEHRLELAESVWASMKATDSRECRNCHAFEHMDFAKQPPEAAKRMQAAMKDGGTCIDCHKGIAHKMPDLAARARKEAKAFMERTEKLDADALWTKRTTALYSKAGKDSEKLATVLPGVGVTRLAQDGDFIKVRVDGWQAGQVVRGQYARFGLRILNLSISGKAVDKVKTGETRFYKDGNQDWTASSLEGWIAASDMTADEDMLWTVAGSTFRSQCGVCHSAPEPGSRGALIWQADVQDMKSRTTLTPEETRLVLRYLQMHSSDLASATN